MLRPLTLLSAALLCASPAWCDILHLRSGGRLEGEVVEVGDLYVVQLRSGKTEVPKDKVVRVEKKTVPWMEYAQRQSALELEEVRLGARSADRHCELGRWCVQAGLKPEGIEELRRAVRIDPEHASARAQLTELGLEELDGRWLTHDEKMTSQGFVLHQGKWVPFEDALQERQEKEAMAALRRDQVRAREVLKEWKRPEKRDQALTKWQEIALPARVRPLGEATRDKDEALRRFALDELAKLKAYGTGPYFFHASFEDPIAEHRRFALATLREIGAEEYIPYYELVLREYGGYASAYAAQALSELGAKPAVGHLVWTLWKVTLEVHATHGSVTKPIDGVAVDTVGAGIVTVETPRSRVVDVEATVIIPAREEFEFEQGAVADALAKITGEDFGTDAKAWAAWWKEEGKTRFPPRAAKSKE